MKRLAWFLLGLSLAAAGGAAAAELPLIPDRPGGFQMPARTNYTRAKCGFGANELSKNFEALTALTMAVRRNPVLAEMKGFEGIARIYDIGCDDPDGFGVPARLSFGLAAWFMNRAGKPVFNDIEPPEWSVLVNRPRALAQASFEPDKTWFTIPARRETLAPGIERFDGEIYVVVDPSRPPLFVPLNVGEAYARMKAYWTRARARDPITADAFLKMIEAEFAATPKADLDKPAHDKGGIGATADPALPAIVRVNPAHWDRNLSPGAIQVMSFRIISNRRFLEDRRRQALRDNSISHPLYRFEESLDADFARQLQALVGK